MTISASVSKAPLRQGDDSDAVRAVQLELARRGYALHGTGYFGDLTTAAVKDFQFKHSLKPTGEVDPLTAAQLDIPTAAPQRPAPAVNIPPWLSKAISCIGVSEVPGKGDSPVILAMAKACGGDIAREYTHDEIAWCKMFTEFCLVSTGFKGTDSLWALDNRTVGTSLSGPAVGSIATKKRDGGGHTFFTLGKDKFGRIVGVGGNQSDRVCRATFDPEVLKHNWPAGYPLPANVGLASLPIVDSAALSKREA